jgi:hypothetical protein
MYKTVSLNKEQLVSIMRTIVLYSSFPDATARYPFLSGQAAGLLRTGKDYSLDYPIVRTMECQGTFLDASDYPALERRTLP